MQPIPIARPFKTVIQRPLKWITAINMTTIITASVQNDLRTGDVQICKLIRFIRFSPIPFRCFLCKRKVSKHAAECPVEFLGLVKIVGQFSTNNFDKWHDVILPRQGKIYRVEHSLYFPIRIVVRPANNPGVAQAVEIGTQIGNRKPEAIIKVVIISSYALEIVDQ